VAFSVEKLPRDVTVSELHTFDIVLCDYLRFNIGRHLEDRDFAPRLDRLDPRLADFFKTRFDGPPSTLPFLLNDKELGDLERIIEELPMGKARWWIPAPRVHRDFSLCTGEINRRLSRTEAEKWAEDSAAFVRQLEEEPLDFPSGFKLVCEWIDELHFYLDAMGEKDLLPAPQGGFPTPTNPNPPKPVARAARAEVELAHPTKRSRARTPEEDDVEKMRQAIREHKLGAEASVRALRKLAHMNNQRARDALRVLEAAGEYHGFGRDKAEQSTDSSTEPTALPPIAPTEDGSSSGPGP
jgi:hypothetical protein